MKVIDLTVGVIFGTLFSVGIIIVLLVFFLVLIPVLFYFTVREVLKQLMNK